MHHSGNILSSFILALALLPGTDPTAPRTAFAQTNNSKTLAPSTTNTPKLDPYGDPIPTGALLRLGTIRLRHAQSVNGVTFSPDGKTIASCGWDHPIRLWDAETGSPIRQLTGSVDCGSFAAAFSPNGQHLATGGEQGLVRLFDIASGNELWKSITSGERVYDIAYSPDGKTIATAAREPIVRLWNAKTGEQIKTFDSPARAFNSHAVTISPDGKLLACGAGPQVQIYNLATSTKQTIKLKAQGYIDGFSLAFSSDSQQIAVSGNLPTIWRIDTGELVRKFDDKQDNGSNSAIALSKDGVILASLGTKSIRIWNVATGELSRTITDYYNSFGPRTHAIAISPDNNTMATIGPHNVVMLWNLETGKRILPFPESHFEQVESVACSPTEPIAASASRDGDVRLWDLKTGKHLRSFSLGKAEPRNVSTVKFSPDGNDIAAGGYDWTNHGDSGLVSVWRVADGKLRWSAAMKDRVTSLEYSNSGRSIAIGVGLGKSMPVFDKQEISSTLDIVDANTGAKTHRFDEPSYEICAIVFSPNDTELTAVEAGKAVTTWNLANPDATKQFDADAHSRQINSAALSSDGRLLITSGLFENLLILWDPKTGSGLRQIESKEAAEAS